MRQRETRSPRYFFRRHLRLQRVVPTSLATLALAPLAQAATLMPGDAALAGASNAEDLAELGTRHQLASRLTCLVAMEATPRRAQGDLQAQQPVMQGATLAAPDFSAGSHDALTDLVFVTALALLALALVRSRS